MSGVYVPPMQDKSLMTTIMKGLAIARDVYGLKSDIDANARAEEQAEAGREDRSRAIAEQERIASERKRLAEGKLTKGEVLEKEFSGYRQAPRGTKGGIDITTDKGEALTLVKPVTVKPTGPDPYTRTQDLLGHTTKLRDKYDSDPTTKRTLGVIDAYKAITGAANAENPTGATDIRLVYSFMKAMDPNSTVREGEYATAENSGGAWNRLGLLYNKLLEGQRLTPEQRAAFADEAEAMVQDQLASQGDTDSRYEALSRKYGVDARDIVDPRFKGFKPRGKSGGTTVSTSPKAAGGGGPYTPGSIVELNGEQYVIGADGKTGKKVGATAGSP